MVVVLKAVEQVAKGSCRGQAVLLTLSLEHGAFTFRDLTFRGFLRSLKFLGEDSLRGRCFFRLRLCSCQFFKWAIERPTGLDLFRDFKLHLVPQLHQLFIFKVDHTLRCRLFLGPVKGTLASQFQRVH